MNLKRYQNEIILAASLLFVLFAYGYKSAQHSTIATKSKEISQEVAVLEETVSLQKIWGDKRIVKRLEQVKSMVPESKVKWRKEGNKVTLTMHDLQPSELNNVVTKLLNIPVQIRHMTIEKKNNTYDMEFACKW